MRRRFPWAILYLLLFFAGIGVAYSLSSEHTQQNVTAAFKRWVD